MSSDRLFLSNNALCNSFSYVSRPTNSEFRRKASGTMKGAIPGSVSIAGFIDATDRTMLCVRIDSFEGRAEASLLMRQTEPCSE